MLTHFSGFMILYDRFEKINKKLPSSCTTQFSVTHVAKFSSWFHHVFIIMFTGSLYDIFKTIIVMSRT